MAVDLKINIVELHLQTLNTIFWELEVPRIIEPGNCIIPPDSEPYM